MSHHLSAAMLDSLIDGELAETQSAEVSEHLSQCPSCTSAALRHSLLKASSATAGHRYAIPPDVEQRLRREARPNSSAEPRRNVKERSNWGGLTAIAVLALLACTAGILMQRHIRNSQVASAEQAIVTEVCDLHIATLAANQPPQVLSSDRHTVKPWFQGKLPFSFNLPDDLPSNARLDGANLTYINDRPVAQLLYSIGGHHVSVFLNEGPPYVLANLAHAERQGFHVMEFRAAHLEGVAVSDVDPAALAELVRAVEDAQTPRG